MSGKAFLSASVIPGVGLGTLLADKDLPRMGP